MTIRRQVDISYYNQRLSNLQQAAVDAPDGTHVFTKDFVAEFDDAFRVFHKELTERMNVLGLKISNTDAFREIEALTYGMILNANPGNTELLIAEAFGQAMLDDSPGHSGNTVRQNVLNGLIRDRDFIRNERARKMEAEIFDEWFGEKGEM